MSTSPFLDAVRLPQCTTATSTPSHTMEQYRRVIADEDRLMSLMETLLNYYEANSYRTMSEQMAETLTLCCHALETQQGHHIAYCTLRSLIRAEKLYRYDDALREAVRNVQKREVQE